VDIEENTTFKFQKFVLDSTMWLFGTIFRPQGLQYEEYKKPQSEA
jgi:hypothetical protein